MNRRAIPYSAEEMAWLEANCTLVIGDYHAAFCATFARDVSAQNLNGLRKRKGWKTGRTGRYDPGSVPANKGKKMPFNENCARTQFKKGQLPHNTKQLGHERVRTDGYIEISVDETNPYTGYERRYVFKHRHLWEQKNGPLPKGHSLKALDGDKTNTDPDNWVAVPRALLPRLNGGRSKKHLAYNDAAPEVRPALLAVARLDHEVRSRGRRKAEGKS